MIKQFKLSTKGSMTIEACIIVPTVLFCVLSVIYICLLLYQQVYIQSLADRAAQRGAAIWTSPAKDMYIGRITKKDMEDNDPYWSFVDSDKGMKLQKITDYIKLHAESYSVLKSTNVTVDTPELTNYIIYKKLRVTVHQSFKIPLGRMLTTFGLSDEFTLEASAEAVVNEPAEFIRNTDFIVDTGREIDRRIFNDKVGNFADQIKGFFSKVMGKLGDFLKK
ncbi:MAG: pilus assembly protein TadE [Clostridia bacterium]|nr:pilus assembly protein TadE [Clostridia bacterium]